MLTKDHRIALFMQDSLGSDNGKMGYGIMRYSANPTACVIDSTQAGQTVRQACGLPFDVPVVSSIAEAQALGANVIITGTAPSGGRIPKGWLPALHEALAAGMSLVNGLHDSLSELLDVELSESQFIWDIRQPQFTPQIGSGLAANQKNLRVLMIGTDMAIGKMTVGLELYRWSQRQSLSSAFVATGQVGISITGSGIPLDCFKVDHACGAVETAVLREADKDLVFIEGQGSLLHPGSSATLALMRGSCANRFILCHQAGMTSIETSNNKRRVRVPPLRDFIQLNEQLASVYGSLTTAKTVGIALNTSHLSDLDAKAEIARLENELGLPVQDLVRYGAEKLGNALLSSANEFRL
jgi:uncharacterized NAD-dependent epimerase/dehydratase family protein